MTAAVVASGLSVSPSADASPAERMWPDVVSTAKTEINFQLVDSEQTGIFTRAEADYSLGKLHLVTLVDGAIQNSETIGFSDPRYKDSDPWLSPAGTELFFISNRPAFLGDVREDEDDYDIWLSRRAGSDWTAPEHLSSVNSLAGEFGPELHRGFLYFSSQKRGAYEIYRAPMTGEGFGEPELLSGPFNGPHLNSDFTLTRDGRVALWWSTRPGGYGSGDLYVSRLTDEGWTDALNLGPEVNSKHLDFTPSLSPNNAVLYFASNRPVQGQDSGASDLYSIPVKDLGPLRDAILSSNLDALKAAFGGAELLKKIDSISYRLDTQSPSSGPSTEEVFASFACGAIAVRIVGGEGYQFARLGNERLPVEKGRSISGGSQSDLIDILTANFLFYLTDENLQLAGPENVSGHGHLNWHRLLAGGAESPLVGIDPLNGRIVKVLTDSGAVVLELDYLKDGTGLVWPYRFIVTRENRELMSGRFSELRINGPAPDGSPAWLAGNGSCERQRNVR